MTVLREPARARHAPEVTRRVEILGCAIDALDLPATVSRCLELARDGRGHVQVSINAAKVVQLADDPDLARFVRGADVVSADGQSIVLTAALLRDPLPGRVPGIDVMHGLIAAAAATDLSIFILGARQEALDEAIRRLRRRYPTLKIAGSHHGYFRPDEEAAIVNEIEAAAPNILFVAMGSPEKERFLARHAERIGAGLAMGVGGAIDVLAGVRTRAPRWMQRAGLEWVHRLTQDPTRLWRRYLIANLRFGWLVVREGIRGLRGTG